MVKPFPQKALYIAPRTSRIKPSLIRGVVSILAAFMAIVLSISSPLHAQSISKTDLYVWTDSSGIRHYTDDKKKAAPKAQKKVVEIFIPPAPLKELVPYRPANGKSSSPSLPPIPDVLDMAPPSSSPPISLPPLPGFNS